MVLAVNKYDYDIFLNGRVVFSETSIQTVYHYEKVLKASNMVWFVSSACNLRRHWSECVGRVPVNRTFRFTGAIDILQGANIV